MKHFILLSASILFYSIYLHAQVSVAKSLSETGPDPNFHIYICFGQSNMEGPAAILEEDTTDVDPRFQVMTVFSEDYDHLGRSVGNWYRAVPPLCRWYTGLGPYDYFGRTLVDSLPDSIKVGVIVVAMGGSGIDAFDKDNYVQYYANADAWQRGLMDGYGGCPYAKIIEMAKIAQQTGVIKGILLHQGESNNGQADWPLKVKKIYYDMLEDLEIEPDTIPFLAGEMLYADQGGICWGHNNIIATLPYYIPNSYAISAEGCAGGDEFHFTHEGMVELGKHYGLQMYSLLKTYNTEEGQTVDHLAIEDTIFTLLTGSFKRIPLTAVFEDGHTLDIRYKATYDISNPEAIQITNGYIKTIKDGEATITASYRGTLGEQKQVVFCVKASTFPMSNELLNPSIFSTGTFDETTHTLHTGQWGFGGWTYNNGLDLSDYKYLVVQLGSDNNASIDFKLFDGNNYWSASTSSQFGNSREVVVNFEYAKKSDGTFIDPSHIYIAGFWSDGSNPFIIDSIFLSNSSEYDPPVIFVNDTGGVNTFEINGFNYVEGFGPSAIKSFTVSGELLTNDIVIKPPSSFEVSIDTTLGFSSSVTLNQNDSLVDETNVYIRMKSGLSYKTYTGSVVISSTGAYTRRIALSGTVEQYIGIDKLVGSNATVVSTEYYTITGQKIYDIDNLKGIYIIKKIFSDGMISTTKIMRIQTK